MQATPAPAPAPAPAESRTPVFGYGSNGIEQLQDRCKNVNLKGEKAFLNNYTLCFAGRSGEKWNYGAIATICPMRDQVVYGSIVYLTEHEITLLDKHEGGYTKKQIKVIKTISGQPNTTVLAQTYIKDKNQWITWSGRSGGCPHKGEPSPKYLKAIQKHLAPNWPQKSETITIRKADDLSIVREWSSR